MVVGELTQERDLIIIGGGPGGYHAAIRAAQLGLQVTLIERGELGGVCLNEGCIPSKVHTTAAQNYNQLNSMKSMGIDTSHASFNLSTLQEYKKSTIRQLMQGIEALCKANKIEVLKGEATFLSSEKIGVENGHQYDTYSFKHAIIATGSKKKPLIEVKDSPLTVTSIWNLDEIPNQLILYGSDDITLEAAMCFRKFGAEVTIIFPNGQDDFTFDSSITKELTRQLKKQKIKLIKGLNFQHAQLLEEGWEVKLHNEKEETHIFKSSHFFVAADNEVNHKNLGLGRAGINGNFNDKIEINEFCQTNLSHIYAIGDITSGPALAVKAIKQGKVAAENIAGYTTEVDFTYIPRVLHTIPPISSVGLTEEEAIENGYVVKIGESSFKSSGYASILGQKDGFVKTISEKDTDLLLGVHIIGVGAIELITSGIFALEMVGREEDLLFPTYPHPSMNEGLLESIEDLTNKAIHRTPINNNKKVGV